MRLISSVFCIAILAAGPGHSRTAVDPADRLLHERILTLDSHLDISPMFLRQGWRFEDTHHFEQDNSQVDLPRMQSGGLDGGFFVVFARQGPLTTDAYNDARDLALMRAMAIRATMSANRDRIGLATSADEAMLLHQAGKSIAFMSMENGYALGTDLSLLKTFYRFGVRMAGPVHNRNNQLVDSATDTPRWNGLSALGSEWVRQMNRLGIIVDGSHASDAALKQMISLSATPVILSHSGPKAILDHPRNISDDLMRQLARSGGVMQVNSLFLVPGASVPERETIRRRQRGWQRLNDAERQKLLADKGQLDHAKPVPYPTLDRFMEALLHAVRVMGVDHVGIGMDWDGGGGMNDVQDVAGLPAVTARLRAAGLSESDISKIWSGNLLRVLRQAEAARDPNSACSIELPPHPDRC